MANREENLKKINAELEKLSDEQLEQVVGGTVKELEELTTSLYNHPALKALTKTGTHIPGTNKAVADVVEGLLGDDFNIDAKISLGLFGTGVGSSKNTYRDMSTGKYLTHESVVERLKNCYQS